MAEHAGPPTGIAVPGLEYVFTIRAEIGETRSGGAGPLGERLHIPITGGTVKGPRLTGRIMPGGSDWPVVRQDGSSAIMARYTIIADDGSPIMVVNEGLRVSSPEVTKRLRAGEQVDPSQFYFRATPRFEAPGGPHQWLNDSIFVASVARQSGGVVVAVWRVT